MTQAQRMRRALDKIVIPRLREAGFEGKYPHFRRDRGSVMDLIMFVRLKYGNGFEVGGSVVFPGEKRMRQNVFRPKEPIDEKLHPEWKAFAERGIGEMCFPDTQIRNVLPGMGWNHGGAFYYSDVYRQFDPTLCSFVYTAVGEKQGETFTPKPGMKLVQKADAELPSRIAEEVSRQLEGLLSWFGQIQCWDDLAQWQEARCGKRPWYDRIRKVFRTIADNW